LPPGRRIAPILALGKGMSIAGGMAHFALKPDWKDEAWEVPRGPGAPVGTIRE
jgi:hypothetical protein